MHDITEAENAIPTIYHYVQVKVRYMKVVSVYQ